MRTLVLTAVVLTLGVTSVAAHPGHGDPAIQDGLQHYLASPLHFVPWICLAVVAGGGFLMLKRRTAARRTIAVPKRNGNDQSG